MDAQTGSIFLGGFLLAGFVWFLYTRIKASKEKSGTSGGSGGGGGGGSDKPPVHRK